MKSIFKFSEQDKKELISKNVKIQANVCTCRSFVMALNEDGTIQMFGTDKFTDDIARQWTDVVKICGGDDHVLGLKADGTAVAFGDNSCGQCDVSNWKNIKDIQTNGNFSVGIETNGRVIVSGSSAVPAKVDTNMHNSSTHNDKKKAERKKSSDVLDVAKTQKNKKNIYLFSQGDIFMRELLGTKGSWLAEMTKIGIPVPPGFIITTETCTRYYEDGRRIDPDISRQIAQYMNKLEEMTGKGFGDKNNPLLVSVRSGARAWMPGLLPALLNLGMNDEIADTLAVYSGNPRWAYDCYIKLIQSFSDSVMCINPKGYDRIIDQVISENHVNNYSELSEKELKQIIKLLKTEYKTQIGMEFPSDPREQLIEAIKAIFRSWENPRAAVYRRENNIPFSWGTAVIVQAMAYGNMGHDCGAGIAFSRDPATGQKGIMGEFLPNSQGDEVISGIRTPMTIDGMNKDYPEAYKQLYYVCAKLEKHFRDMMDIGFVVEHGNLFIMESAIGKNTAQARVRIACDMVDEGLISEIEAVQRIDSYTVSSLLKPQFDANDLIKATPAAKGLGASIGAACGHIVFSTEDAIEWGEAGRKVILVMDNASPDDIDGIKSAEGVLTTKGGMTSDAAVISRGLGKTCVVGCSSIVVSKTNKTLVVNGKKYFQGDFLSIDGSTGNIFAEYLTTKIPKAEGYLSRIMNWADKHGIKMPEIK